MNAVGNTDHDSRLTHVFGRKQDNARGEVADQMRPDSADDENIAALLDDASVKVELEESWGSVVTRRKFMIGRRTAIWVLALVNIIILAAFLKVAVIDRFVRPTVEAQKDEQRYQSLFETAQIAMAEGKYPEAINAFARASTHPLLKEQAQAGELQAQRMAEVDLLYRDANKAWENQDYAEANNLFNQIEVKVPGYRDVPQRLEQWQEMQSLFVLYEEGEDAYQRQDWEEVIPPFERLRSMDSSFLTAQVTSHLYDAYVKSAELLLQSEDAQVLKTRVAEERVRRAVLLRPDDPDAEREARVVRTYVSGLNALSQGDLNSAMQAFVSIYDVLPRYLGGLIAEQLFRVYLALGDQKLATSERLDAIDFYGKASQLPVADSTEARLRLEAVAAGPPPTPTVTPTPTPLPTPKPDIVPGAGGEPEDPPLKLFKGWIAFISTRDNETGLYVMRPDGSGQRRVRKDDIELYYQMRERERWSPSGTTRVYAEGPKGKANDVNIFVFREDLPQGWDRRFQYTDWGALEYDPVWSPDNKWIAFVSNISGNDEIWIMTSEGMDHKQLTHNTWEWDKHPSFSPDSTKIVFWTNREGGNNQIWVMDVDGNNQFNLSNNEFEDQEPVWIK
ncbi:MAG: PD40 domain-containing protein [Caldilineales bacterium]|nr:PD40 domain-containing protein [Caldilineales bacterium]